MKEYKDENSEVFLVEARRCKRCGGLLFSEYGLNHGMGHICRQKDIEEREAEKRQMNIFEAMRERGGEDVQS